MSETKTVIYLDAELRPNASLSPRAFTIVMCTIGLLSFATGVFYLAIGAWPVLGFFGLDALAIWCAFRLSFRSQEQVTYVRVDDTHVRLWHMQRGKPDKKADLPTAFVRVTLDEPITQNSLLTLQYGNAAWVIGRFLTPIKRKEFARDLRAAIVLSRKRSFSV